LKAVSSAILLVRHGQTRSNISGFFMGRLDEDLDQAGRDQVKRLGLRLAKLSITAVFTSPLKRATSTANAISTHHGLQPAIEPELTEIDVGLWQGLHEDVIQRRWPETWEQWKRHQNGLTMPGGESVAMVGERAFRSFKAIATRNRGKLVVVVSHEVVIKTILARVLDTSEAIYRRLETANAGISVVLNNEGGFILNTLNDVTHLGDFPASITPRDRR
jgi:broad specificity phosphatase PhoE